MPGNTGGRKQPQGQFATGRAPKPAKTVQASSMREVPEDVLNLTLRTMDKVQFNGYVLSNLPIAQKLATQQNPHEHH